MILRKQKLIYIIVGIVIALIIAILGVIGLLYLKTDMFKSNEVLFSKYFMQNFDIVEILKNDVDLGVKDKLNQNRYKSEIEGKIEYTQNLGTSDENKNNPINNIKLKVNSNIDKINNYSYRDIAIENNQNNLVKMEYLNEYDFYGVRLQGIQQFVSIDTKEDDKRVENIKIYNFEKILEQIQINEILNLTEEEKQNIANTYLNIIQNKIQKERYNEQKKSLITVNNKDIQVNSYYITLTIEEYNNLITDILNTIAEDEIILSKIDLIEEKIKLISAENYETNKSLRESFVENIYQKVQEIQDNNIGNDEVRVTVFESEGKTVRTSVEKITEKIMIDLYDGSSIRLSKIKTEDVEKETFFKIEKQNETTNQNILFEYGTIENNEIVNDFKCNFMQSIEEENVIQKQFDIEISNLKNKMNLSLYENIEIVQEFLEEYTFDEENVNLNELEDEQFNMVIEILNTNIEQQLANLNSTITSEEIINILKDLGIVNSNGSVQLPKEGEISEIEKKRFNSQFEFFVSDNLTTDNVKQLINVCKDNFEEMKVLLKSGEIEDLNIEKIDGVTEDREYINNISEILVLIKTDTKNNKKEEDTIKFLDKYSENTYNVFLQYDDIGLVRLVRIQIREQ